MNANTLNTEQDAIRQDKNLLSKRVATVIITFNPSILNLIAMLRAHIAADVSQIIIVDNASLNLSAIEEGISSFGTRNIELLRQSSNLGVAAAQNIGIAHAVSAGCTHVVLFDQDSQPPSDMIGNLLVDEAKLTVEGAHVGAIGPNFYDPRSGMFYPQNKICGPLLKKILVNPSNASPVEVSFIIASGSLIRTDVLKKVGPMNEDFFIDKVDLEWCFRAHAKGYLLFVSSRAVMAHSVGDHRVRSFGREISIHSPVRRYYMARNSILLARQPWVPAGYRIREMFYDLARTVTFLVAVRFNVNYVQHIFKGILHGFLGRGGQYK